MSSTIHRILVIRADASARMGTGHLMRCLALGQAWKDAGGRVSVVTACSNNRVLKRLFDEGFWVQVLDRSYPDPQDWITTNSLLEKQKDAWVVLDGYHFDAAYQRIIKKSGYRLLVIDGIRRSTHYYADVVLNPDLYAEELHYPCEPYTRLLLGTRYMLLRREFLRWRDWKRPAPRTVRKVLVTLGGGDEANVTELVIRALTKIQLTGLEIIVVVGASNPYRERLESAKRVSEQPIRLLSSIDNMPELMAWADIAIASSGTTVWELAFMQVPSLLIVTADNQLPKAAALHRLGVFHNLGWWHTMNEKVVIEELASLIESDDRRRKMTEAGRQLVDGKGVELVMSVLN